MRYKNDDGDVQICDRRVRVRGFLTPPPTWTPPHSRAHRRLFPPPPSSMDAAAKSAAAGSCKTDLFHVIHKVPAGDSPYVKAKQVQLIEKDPSRAVSMFWAAINAGDRVDSALKDMAVVLKQLNRSDEAIEAIKSFRHLCVEDSQESIDNVLVELYKRSGRVEEEIEMLQRKLKNIEDGMVFGGRKTKVARSQGKKIQITIEQEKARILGNLAWAYLQQHNYGLAEQHYRRALSLESDRNKQCNLAVCLMHMNKLTEARSLLQAVKASCGKKPMDESYSKSFERAYQMLTDFEKGATPQSPSSWSPSPQQSPAVVGDHGWRECPYFTSPVGSFAYGGEVVQGSCTVPRRHRPGCAPKKNNSYASSPMPVLFSQPRRCLFGDARTEGRWGPGGFQPFHSPNTPQLRTQPKWTPSDGDWRKPWRPATTSENSDNSTSIVVKFPVEETMVSHNNNDGSENAAASKDEGSVYHKSWADMVEEEEELEKQLLGWTCDDDADTGEGSLDENWDANVGDAEKKSCYGIKDQHGTTTKATTTAVRRLCFDGAASGKLTRTRNRLQVFRDITPTPADSPRAL